MATLSLCVGRVGRLREEFALRVLSERTLASSTFSGTIMLASGTTLTYRISELASQTRASGARRYLFRSG